MMGLNNFLRRILGTASFPRLKRQAKAAKPLEPGTLGKKPKPDFGEVAYTFNPVTKTHPLRRSSDFEATVPVDNPPPNPPRPPGPTGGNPKGN